MIPSATKTLPNHPWGCLDDDRKSNKIAKSLTLQSSFYLFIYSLISLAFFVRFPFFSRDFRGSAKRKTPCLFSGLPLLFFFSQKKQGLEGQGCKCDFGLLSSNAREECKCSVWVKDPRDRRGAPITPDQEI